MFLGCSRGTVGIFINKPGKLPDLVAESILCFRSQLSMDFTSCGIFHVFWLLVLPGVAVLSGFSVCILWDTVGEECTGNVERPVLCSVHCWLSVIHSVRGSEWFAVCSVNGFNRKTYFPFVFTALCLLRT